MIFILNFVTCTKVTYPFIANKNGIIMRQYSVKSCWEKQQELANLRQKRYFKSEIKHSKRFDHVTDDIMSLFW